MLSKFSTQLQDFLFFDNRVVIPLCQRAIIFIHSPIHRHLGGFLDLDFCEEYSSRNFFLGGGFSAQCPELESLHQLDSDGFWGDVFMLFFPKETLKMNLELLSKE